MSTEEDYIDLKKIFNIFSKKRLFISFSSALFMLVGVGYALSLPNLYKSDSLLISSSDDSSSNISQSVGNFAALAGIDISAGESSAERQLTIATNTLRSRKFFKIFVDKYDLMPSILAGKGYDSGLKQVSYDQSKYNPITSSWTSEFQKKGGVSYEDAYDMFWSKYVSFSQGEELSVYELSVMYFSPEISKKWNELLINEINDYMRTEDKKLNLKLLDYYQQKLSDSTLVSTNNVISALMSSKLRSLALIESNPNYVFTPVDPPYVPEKKDSPRRSIIVISFFFLGLFLSVAYILLKEIFRPK